MLKHKAGSESERRGTGAVKIRRKSHRRPSQSALNITYMLARDRRMRREHEELKMCVCVCVCEALLSTVLL